jgi:glucose dehydrogenase
MTYLYKGRQYVVVAVEGNAATKTATQLLAFTLPDTEKPAAPRPE